GFRGITRMPGMLNYLEQNRASDNYPPKLASMRRDADQTVRRGAGDVLSMPRVIPGRVLPGRRDVALAAHWLRLRRWASRHRRAGGASIDIKDSMQTTDNYSAPDRQIGLPPATGADRAEPSATGKDDWPEAEETFS
ncbi:MAG: hypothetical protein ACLPQY_35705, partial [Streptosporangiaceae bacterium]